LSTIIRDRSDHEVVEVDKNHWEVKAAYSADHNYNDDSLEVKDAGGHVVLQVHILPDRIQLRGIWHDAFGHGAQITECPDPLHGTGRLVGCVQEFGSNWPEEDKMAPVVPTFKYPSREHWAEMVIH
jgi:hypothetical protein